MSNLAASFFFDHHGARIDRLPVEVVEFLCPSHDRLEVEAYLIDQLGWVKITIDAHGLSIAFHAVMASFGAIYGCHQFLAQAGIVPIRITYDLDGRIQETYSDVSVARARLVEIAERVAEFFNRPRFSSIEKSPTDLASEVGGAGRALGAALQAWQDSAGRLSVDVKKKLKSARLLDRTMLFDIDPASGRGRFQYVGRGFTHYGSAWRAQAIGRFAEEQPDERYVESTYPSYRKAIDTGRPLYEHVDAGIRAKGQPLRRSRYKVLKTLWRDDAGTAVLMVSSVLTPDIDIPLLEPKAAPERRTCRR